MTNKKQNLISWALVIVVAAAVLVLVFYPKGEARGDLDDFAQCLTGRGFVFYYTDWCPYCRNEKQSFGNSFELIESVNCTADSRRCTELQIEAVPTWTFGENESERAIGAQGLERLSELSGCPLP